MPTFALMQPESSPLAALPSTLFHAAVVAGAIWASGATVASVEDSPIEIPLTWTAHPTTRPATTTSVHIPGIPLIGSPTIPDLPEPGPIPTLPGTTIDPRQFTHESLPGGPATTGGDPVGDSEVDDLPTLISSGRLRYPAVFADAGVEGSVTLLYVIDIEGRVEEAGIEVLSASHAGFIPAAREAVTTSRFRPAKKGSHPVRVRVRQTITFRR